MKRLWAVFGLLSGLILLTFFWTGARFEQWFSPEASTELLRSADLWAGPLGAGLLMSDLLLPIPTTVVIAAMGATLGVGAAAVWAWLGLVAAGLLGYGAARIGGRSLADRLSPPAERARYQRFFDQWGGVAVVISRMLPILPEVLSVMAGVYGMKAGRFVTALSLGSISPALSYAWLGARVLERPGTAALGLSLLTLLAWFAFTRLRRRASDA